MLLYAWQSPRALRVMLACSRHLLVSLDHFTRLTASYTGIGRRWRSAVMYRSLAYQRVSC
jgi:hypothetical protein